MKLYQLALGYPIKRLDKVLVIKEIKKDSIVLGEKDAFEISLPIDTEIIEHDGKYEIKF